MLVCDLNPFVRFASQIYYKSAENPVFARDARLFYILSGSAEIFIENKHYALCPNAVFYCASGSMYNIVAESGVSLFSLNFDLTQSKNHHLSVNVPVPAGESGAAMGNPPSVSDSEFLNAHLFLSSGAEFLSAIKNITEEFSSQKKYFREKCSGLLKELLVDLHRGLLHNSENVADAVHFTAAFINDHFSEELENKDLASLTGYHEYYLNRLFIEHTGMSMHKYILNLRINEAKRLLLNTDLSVGLISEKVGFHNNTHFSNYFKKATGLAPSQFRNSFKNRI